MLKRLRPLTLIAVALLAGALALPAHALQFNYSTRLTLTDCDDADEAGFNTGTTTLCYDLTAAREEIWNGSAWVAYQGGGAAITSIVPGTGATNAGKARSSSAGATDTGFAPWAVRDDALSTVAEDEGEYTPLKTTSTGGLWMSIATPLGDSAMDDTANAVKMSGGSVSGACSNADVDTIETLCTITVTGYDKCSMVFTVATAILSDFNVDLANDATTFVTIATSATDYTSPAGHIYGASGDLTVAATSGTHFVEVDGLAGWDTLRLQAAGTSSAVTGTYRCTKE